jgi:hypothetical protein
VKVAGIIGSTLLGLVIMFHVALAFGAPFGKAAWGGQHEGVLPKRLRIVSGVVAFVFYPLIIVAVLDAAGLFGGDLLPGNGSVVMWILAVLFLIGALANLASRSTLERFWAPVSLAIAVCCASIAAGL